MEKCKFSKRLNIYLENEVTKAERVVIENHLKNCSICQKVLTELKEEKLLISDFLSEYKEQSISDSFKNKIIASTKNVHKRPTYLKRVVEFSIAVSLTLSFALGILISRAVLNENTEIAFSNESLASIEAIYAYIGE